MGLQIHEWMNQEPEQMVTPKPSPSASGEDRADTLEEIQEPLWGVSVADLKRAAEAIYGASGKSVGKARKTILAPPASGEDVTAADRARGEIHAAISRGPVTMTVMVDLMMRARAQGRREAIEEAAGHLRTHHHEHAANIVERHETEIQARGSK